MSSEPTPVQAEMLRRTAEALARRDAATALALLDQVDAAGATHPAAMARAMALRLSGDLAGALTVMDRALAMQPYDFVALLGKGAVLEQVGRSRTAIDVYRNAIKIAPPRDRLPPPLVGQLDHAADVVGKHARALGDFMRAEVEAMRVGIDAAVLDRFDEGLDIYAGLKTAPKQEPLLLNYPRLPAIQIGRAHV